MGVLSLFKTLPEGKIERSVRNGKALAAPEGQQKTKDYLNHYSPPSFRAGIRH